MRPSHSLLGLALALSLTTCGESSIAPPRQYQTDLAEDIPMTGEVDPMFEEVDIAMRQFMKWRCIGAGTLAISYKGRRVYKRGFGRMHGRASEELLEGCGDDETNPFDPEAPLVQPDTPMLIGSCTKPVTAAVARWLVDERMQERGITLPPCEGELCACDEPPCPATAADVPLLHPQMDLLPEHIAEVMRGDVPVPVPAPLEEGEEAVPCVEGADTAYADPRWPSVTLGQLISHQSGLNRSSSPVVDLEEGSLIHAATLRGYDPADEDPWRAEHEFISQLNPEYRDNMEQSRAWLSELHGGANVYFVNLGNVVAGHRPYDETFLMTLGRCLDYSPGQDAYFEHDTGPYDSIDRSGGYSNAGLTMVGRIVDHIQAERTGRYFAAQQGDVDSHWDSALEEFFRVKVGIEGGVETPEGIFTRQVTDQYRAPIDHPTPRFASGSGDEAYPDDTSVQRPYCVMVDGECSLEPWHGGSVSGAVVRPPYDFTPPEDGSGFAQVPLWRRSFPSSASAGGLLTEAPVYLEFSRRYGISSENSEVDNGNGAPRDWTKAGGHNGSLGGGYAYVLQLEGRTRLQSLPPVIDGHLVDEFQHFESVLIDEPDDVDVVVAINQSYDPRCIQVPSESRACSSEYRRLRTFVLYGLSQVDWEAVAAEVEAQSRTIVAMAVDAQGHGIYWYADDKVLASAQDPASFSGRYGGLDVEAIAPSVVPYDLPSSRIGPDVLGIAMDLEGRVFAWYTDGRVSVGTPESLAEHQPPQRFEGAPEQSLYDIVALARDSRGRTHAFYADGTRSQGSATNLAADGIASYAVADGYALDDLVTVTIEPGAGPDGVDRVWARYADGRVSRGTVDDLGAFD